jgi:hypothetical protein
MADFVGSIACPLGVSWHATAATVPRVQGQGRPPGQATGGQDHDRGHRADRDVVEITESDETVAEALAVIDR